MSSRMAVCGHPPVSTARMRSAGQRVVAHQELGILLREDVVGDDPQLIAIAQLAAQRQQQRRLAAAHRAADADGERARAVVAPLRRRALTERSGRASDRRRACAGTRSVMESRVLLMIEITSNTGGRGSTGTDRSAAPSARCRAGASSPQSLNRPRRCAAARSACIACASYAPMMPEPHGRGADAARRDEEKRRWVSMRSHAEHVEQSRRTAARSGRHPLRSVLASRASPVASGKRSRTRSATRGPVRGWRGWRPGSREIRRTADRAPPRLSGQRWAAVTSGSALRPHCASACRANARTQSLSGTCPCARCLEPARMRESARGERRIDQLPH